MSGVPTIGFDKITNQIINETFYPQKKRLDISKVGAACIVDYQLD